jgi:hypothetical protein
MTGMKGENITDERVWIVKSHHPNHNGGLNYTSNKVIVCVRNPLDIIPSLVNLMSTLSHSAKIDFPYDKDYPEWWDKQITSAAEKHADYFKILMRDLVSNKDNPGHFCRYEDLHLDPVNELESLFKFLLNMNDLTGTNI